MKRITIYNLIWILVGFSIWVFLDYIYVKQPELKWLASNATAILLIWPLILLFPVIKEIRKGKNEIIRDKVVAPVIVIGSLAFQYLGGFGLIVSIGIGIHFSFGGNL